MKELRAELYLVIGLVVLIIVRVLFVLFHVYVYNGKFKTLEPSLPTIVCIGSGGHTTEMMRIVDSLKATKFKPRLYILAQNDATSEVKIHKVEKNGTHYTLRRIPRSRNVRQSYMSSVYTTLNAIYNAFPIVYNFNPSVVLCNGPGTCIPVCVAAFVLRCIFVTDTRIIFVESVCRVRTLSLTGTILQYFADLFVVQWPQLRNNCFRAKYFGRLT